MKEVRFSQEKDGKKYIMIRVIRDECVYSKFLLINVKMMMASVCITKIKK